ncbi:MAG: beta-CASP ribonuclease aCPSF1, partial [Candidatus Heimdallarchaeota archaeon]
MSYKEVLEETSQKILAELPKNSEVSLIEFEGPEVAVYSKNPKVLVDDETIVKELAKKLRKRIVIRSDPGVRLAKDET